MSDNTPTPLAAWRQRLDLSQPQAADALGLCLRAYRYLETGVKAGATVEPRRPILLAAAAIEAGLEPIK